MCDYANRSWFRFSLRTLLLFVTVSGGWLGYHLSWIKQRNAAAEWVREGGHKRWGAQDYGEPARLAPTVLPIFGKQGAFEMLLLARASEWAMIHSKAKHLAELFPEASIGIDYPTPGKWMWLQAWERSTTRVWYSQVLTVLLLCSLIGPFVKKIYALFVRHFE